MEWWRLWRSLIPFNFATLCEMKGCSGQIPEWAPLDRFRRFFLRSTFSSSFTHVTDLPPLSCRVGRRLLTRKSLVFRSPKLFSLDRRSLRCLFVWVSGRKGGTNHIWFVLLTRLGFSCGLFISEMEVDLSLPAVALTSNIPDCLHQISWIVYQRELDDL